MAAAEDFDTVDRIVIVLVVNEHAFFYGNLFSGIADIDDAEQVVGDVQILERRKGTFFCLATFARKWQNVDSVTEYVFHLIEKQLDLKKNVNHIIEKL